MGSPLDGERARCRGLRGQRRQGGGGGGGGGAGPRRGRRSWEACERAEGGGAAGLETSGGSEGSVISQLQECLQGRTSFLPHAKILTWSFEQRLEADASLRFRAVVSFLLRDVPHHCSGDWLTSKKKAQQDTAERVRYFLTCHAEPPDGELAHGHSWPLGVPQEVVWDLQDVVVRDPRACAAFRPAGGGGATGASPLQWDIADGGVGGLGPGAHFRATLMLHIHDVPHHFAGGWCESVEEARRDTAERVLWYLGSNAGAFAANKRLALELASLPPPSSSSDACCGDECLREQEPLEDKTILMQVQNALQKTFAKDTLPGQRVWQWSYEPDSRNPQRFRAHVEVPSWGIAFMGEWCRGKKLAQRSACAVVKRHLEQRAAAAA